MPARRKAATAATAPKPPKGVAVVREEALSLEDELLLQITAAGLPAPIREYPFCPGRRYRADFSYPEHGKILIEVEGGIWTNGRHSRGAGLTADAEKYNAASCLGWRLIRVTGDMIHDGRALAWVERALESAKSNREIVFELLRQPS